MGWGYGPRDQFPVGMRVLAVDDDLTCLKVLETLLLRCQYHVTTTNQAITALKMLRENSNMFDLVISDVHMPDMDGFKLLELVGLEMDLPVIMLSVNGETKTVMKGITHGACDYLLKPVRIEELRNIWQHVVRRKFSNRERNNVDIYEECDKPPSADIDHGMGQIPCGSPEQSGRFSKKRKDQDTEEEDECEENDAHENDDPSAQKKPRVVWSVELHRKFVAAVNQLGIDKAVPKRILELMNVEKLTRENVASHLQKYRLYLKRLSAVASQQASIVAAFGGRDPSFMRVGMFEGLQSYQACKSPGYLPTFSSFSPHGLLSRTSATVSGLQGLAPSKTIQTATGTGTMNHLMGDPSQFQLIGLPDNRHANLTRGLTPSLEQARLQQKWIHEETIDLSPAFSGVSLVNTMSGTLKKSTNSSLLPQELLQCTQSKAVVQPSIRMSSISSEHVRDAAGVSSSLLDSDVSEQNALPITGFSADGLPMHSSFSSNSTAKMEASFSVVPQRERDEAGTSSASSMVGPRKDMVAVDIKNAGSPFGSTVLLPSDTEEHSKYVNFGGADNCRQKMDEKKTDHLLDSRLVWSSFPSSQLPDDCAVRHTTPFHKLDSGCFNQGIGANLIEQMNLSTSTLTDQSGELKPKDAYGLGTPKLHSGLGSNGCNFDGLLNSIIKVEKDDISFMDSDMGCDLYPLGACI